MWTVRQFDRERQAGDLAAELGITRSRVRMFDEALASWLRSYGKRMSTPPYGVSDLPGRPDTHVDEDLAQALDELAGEENLFAWSRLLKAQDALWGFEFGWGVTGPLLRYHLAHAAPAEVDPDQAAAIMRYATSNMADSPNSGAYDELWDLASRSGLLADTDLRPKALVALIEVVARRGFHHNLRDLERILRTVEDEDTAVYGRLRGFRPDNDQGAAIIAGEVMRMVPVDSASSAAHAAEILAWLVDARRKEPTKRWKKRLGELEIALDRSTFRDVCSEVARHPEYARHEGTGWRDELFWFMWKTSAWYFGEVPQRILD